MKNKVLPPFIITLLISALYSCKESPINSVNPDPVCVTTDSSLFINGELQWNYSFEYNASNEVTKITGKLKDGIFTIQNFDQGKLYEYLISRNDSILSSTQYSYFNNGQLKIKKSAGLFNLYSGVYYKDIIETEEYDESGKIIKTTSERPFNETLETVYEYNAAGKTSQKTIYFNGFIDSATLYHYDANNNIIEESESSAQSSRVNKKYYYYNDQNLLISEALARASGAGSSHGYVYDSTYYSYNSKGLLQKSWRTSEALAVPGGSGELFYNYQYDSQSRLTGVMRSCNNSDFNLFLEYLYNSNGDIISLKEYFSDSFCSKESSLGTETRYDEFGRISYLNGDNYSYSTKEACQ